MLPCSWFNQLCPQLKREPFTAHEDALIIRVSCKGHPHSITFVDFAVCVNLADLKQSSRRRSASASALNLLSAAPSGACLCHLGLQLHCCATSTATGVLYLLQDRHHTFVCSAACHEPFSNSGARCINLQPCITGVSLRRHTSSTATAGPSSQSLYLAGEQSAAIAQILRTAEPYCASSKFCYVSHHNQKMRLHCRFASYRTAR